MGSLYALYWSDQFGRPSGFYAGPGTILLAYVVSAMLIGYVDSMLNKRLEDFRRMIISGVVAGTIWGILLFGVFQLSPVNVVIVLGLHVTNHTSAESKA